MSQLSPATVWGLVIEEYFGPNSFRKRKSDDILHEVSFDLSGRERFNDNIGQSEKAKRNHGK